MGISYEGLDLLVERIKVLHAALHRLLASINVLLEMRNLLAQIGVLLLKLAGGGGQAHVFLLDIGNTTALGIRVILRAPVCQGKKQVSS